MTKIFNSVRSSENGKLMKNIVFGPRVERMITHIKNERRTGRGEQPQTQNKAKIT